MATDLRHTRRKRILPMAMTPEELKERRARLQLTQTQLATRMGVTWNTVARWETGQRRIPRMATILMGYLTREEQPPRNRR